MAGLTLIEKFKRMVIGRDNGPLLREAEVSRRNAIEGATAFTQDLRRLREWSDDPLSDIANNLRERRRHECDH